MIQPAINAGNQGNEGCFFSAGGFRLAQPQSNQDGKQWVFPGQSFRNLLFG
jgi:hypothetical protein